MRHGNDSGWTLARGVLIGVVVTAVIMLSFPVVAAVGGNFILGKANTADAVTSLSGAATTNLRITSTQAGASALDLRVVSGSAPLKVNSTTRVANLNADLVDGKHASNFATSGHSHTGVYLPIGGVAADASLLDGRDSSAFAGSGMACPPGALVGYGRTGPLCSATVGSVVVDAAGDVGWWTSLVLDTSGFPVIAYHDYTNSDLKVVHCGNATCSSGNTITTVDSGTGRNPSLVLDASGFPVIAYGYWGDDQLDLRVAHCGNSTCTAGTTIRTVDAPGDVGYDTSLTLDASGFPVISYYDWGSRELKVAHCGDPTCASGNSVTTVDSLGNTGYHTSLLLDASGFPVVAYGDRGGDVLKLVHCGDATCSSGNTITTVDSGAGADPSLVLDASGFPVISYGRFGYDPGFLKLVHCGDATCSSGNTITTVDSGGDVGFYTSLALDASGFPLIAYFDRGNFDLKVVRCGDATCSSGDVVTTVDDTGDVGGDVSLVLDASGNPVIAYHDGTNGDLRLAGVTG
jgi:hypothetical protein